MKKIYKTHFNVINNVINEKSVLLYQLEVTLDLANHQYYFNNIKQNIDCITKQYHNHVINSASCEKLVKELYDKIYQKFFTASVPIISISVKLFENQSFGCEHP